MIAGDSRSVRFDYSVQFTVTQPTRSVATTQSISVQEDGDAEAVIGLFCVRPDAIQQYTLDPALCYPGNSPTLHAPSCVHLLGVLYAPFKSEVAS